ncbi:16S rRNA (uracil(1498)-N(3))-methyltransferase [Flavipsychrobacter stenotrophus]|uniref:Ribosomal RNA small subunit methyltransferase E n=1 Tax=Flavipsychrobacter stenotrophus TaxID=2077091 RepID=A0A2S7SXP6_9BACT|nr:RsmE family RNA methyltransferase [Flavipsychrobacter stenotrophus]PQJ11488.1 16S rRNA (uracil(1498)-N(3))-methyltransferase [Flavipsychrobacter stenotrophus]
MPNLARFYFNGKLIENETITLDDATAKHIWQVLRMEAGDELRITDGKGNVAVGTIRSAERHRCDVVLQQVTLSEHKQHSLHLCVAFTKNNSRNEWLLEKATELGVASITPISAARSEKVHFRQERWEKLLTSALLQSQQDYMPELSDMMTIAEVVKKFGHIKDKYIAHCISEQPRTPFAEMLKPSSETVILIGPEGDFRFDEVSLCMDYGFKPVTLGNQRLRTETAAIAACAHFNMINDGKD